MRSSSATALLTVIGDSSRPVDHTTPMLRLLHPGFLVMSVMVLFAACDRNIVRESGVYGDGARAYEREYRVTPDAGRVPHGAYATWYAGGERRTLEFYRNGIREGYAFEWNEGGDLIRLQACEAGVCEERALPATSRSGETLLAARTLE
jgi:hypothetical protein